MTFKIFFLMKLKEYLNEPSFYMAVKNYNLDIIKLFLSKESLDVNNPHILNLFTFTKIKFKV